MEDNQNIIFHPFCSLIYYSQVYSVKLVDYLDEIFPPYRSMVRGLRKISIPLARRNKREIFQTPNDTNGNGEDKKELKQ
jgi:hypothetical protein